MDIQNLGRRHHTHAAHSSSATEATAATSDTDGADDTTAATSGTDAKGDAATTQHVSGGGRFMHFLQSFEDKHPEEAKRILSGIADKLRHDAEHAGPFAERMEHWADKVQKAADTGDMSNLMPSWQPHAHFGVRAYQKAQEAPDAQGLDQVAAAAQANVSTANSTEAASGVTQPSAASTDTAAVSIESTNTAASNTQSAPGVTTPIISGTPAAAETTRTVA